MLASALIAGITAVVVAILQRTRRSSPDPAASSGGRPFALSEAEWCAVRDRSLTTEHSHNELANRFEGHVKLSDESIDKLKEEIANLKGQLGIR